MNYQPWKPEPLQVQNTATFRADGLAERVIIPVLKAAIVALPTGALVGLLVGMLKLAWPVLYVMGITSLLAFLGVFWGSSKRGQWLIERIAGADLDGDGYTGEPIPAPHVTPVRVELVQDNGRHEDWIDLPFPEKLPELAEGLLSGRSYSLSVWTGTGGLFSRAEFEKIRDVLIGRGLAAWRNPEAKAQGWELTASGRAVMRRLSNRSPSPTSNRM